LDHSDHATLTTRTDNVSGKSQAFPGGSQGSAAHLSLSFSVDFGMFDPLPPTSKINHFGLRPVSLPHAAKHLWLPLLALMVWIAGREECASWPRPAGVSVASRGIQWPLAIPVNPRYRTTSRLTNACSDGVKKRRVFSLLQKGSAYTCRSLETSVERPQ
jgi:hypothetical protein